MLLGRKLTASVLFALTLLGASGSWHASGDDPDLRAAEFVAHDHRADGNRFWSRSIALEPVHCAICHWLQSFRSDSVRPLRAQYRDVGYRQPFVAVVGFVPTTDLVDIPPRAPPA